MPASTRLQDRPIDGGARTVVIATDILEPVAVSSIADTVSVEVTNDIVLDPSSAVRFVDETGTVYGIRQISNKQLVSSKPYLYDIAEGNLPDHYPVRQFGHNADVGADWETIAHGGGLAYYPTSALTLRVKSDDVDDDGAPAGTGAHTVWLNGLDANWNYQSETVTMNGTNAVATTKSYIRMLKMIVVTAGTTGYNEGIICCRDNTDANIMMCIAPGENESHSALYSVPSGNVVYITGWYGSEASNKGSDIALWVREFGGLWLMRRDMVVLDTNFVIPMDVPLCFTEKTDIEMRARGILAGAVITGGFVGWREPE